MLSQGGDGVTGWATGVIESIGELGVGVLIALETVVPPIPSEVILPFAGFSAAQGTINAPLAWVAATIGSLVGAYLLYALGAVLGYDRLCALSERPWFFVMSRSDLERGERVFRDHGAKMVLLGRCVPFVRSAISVPAGLTRMPLWRFTALTGIGSGVWNALFIMLGYRLGDRYEEVQRWAGPISRVVVVALLLGLVWLVVRRLRRRAARRA